MDFIASFTFSLFEGILYDVDFTITDIKVFQEPDGTYSAIAYGTTADGKQIKLQQGGRIPANPSIGK